MEPTLGGGICLLGCLIALSCLEKTVPRPQILLTSLEILRALVRRNLQFMCILSSVFGFFRHWPVTSLADHQLYHLTYHIGLRVYWFRTSFGCHCCEIFVLLQAPLVFMFVFLVVTFVFLVVSFARTLPFPSTVQFSLGRLSSPGAGRQATSDLGFPGPLVDT